MQRATPAAKRPRPQQAVPPVHAGTPETARREQIAEAAYYNAERRHFAPGHELDDWLEAERLVARTARVPAPSTRH